VKGYTLDIVAKDRMRETRKSLARAKAERRNLYKRGEAAPAKSEKKEPTKE